MKTNITKFCAGVFSTFLLAGLSLNADAQVSVTATTLTYTQDFNTLESATGTTFTTLPAGWALAELGTGTNPNGQYRTGDGSVTNGDTYSFGTGTNVDRALGGLASNGLQSTFGVVFTNNTGSVITNLAISYTGEQWRYGGRTATAPATPNPDTLLFSYSTIATAVSDATVANWTSVAALNFTTPNIVSNSTSGVALDGNIAANKATVSGNLAVSIPVGGTIILKWSDRNIAGNDDGLAIDDLSIVFSTGTTPVATNIIATQYTPTGNNVPLTTSDLSVKFDNPIAKGTGNIDLYKVGVTASVASIDVTSTGVTISNDSTAVINLGAYDLENNESYYVNYPAGAFTKTGGTLPNIAISNNTTWAFATEDTVIPPPPTPLTSLDEKFLNCINTEMGVFVQYNETGTGDFWKCSVFGRNKTTSNADSFAVYINGGNATSSRENKDWLISKAPFDFSAMTAPSLSFWQTRRFSGVATRKVLISTDYVAGTDPSTATWTDISTQALAADPPLSTNTSSNWNQISGISLTAHKATPFYLAFTYESNSTGNTYELVYDDIKVENATSVRKVNGATVGVQVLGEATRNQINLNIEAANNTSFEVQLFDLMGRKVATQKVSLHSGSNKVNLTGLDLSGGLYIVRVIGDAGFGTVKAAVK